MCLHLHTEVADAVIWQDNDNGAYTTKSGFNWLMKFLLWLATHNVVSTCSLLHHHNMLPSNACQHCNMEEETVLHCMHDCPMAKTIWHAFSFRDTAFFLESDHVKWLKDGLDSGNEALFLACLWWLWRARNSHIIGNDPMPALKIKYAMQQFYTLIKAYFYTTSVTNHSESWVSSHPTRQQVVVLNMDGSSLGNPGKAGLVVWSETLMVPGCLVSLVLLALLPLFMQSSGLYFMVSR